MTLLIDITSLLVAATGGAFAMWLVLWLRTAPLAFATATAEAAEDEAHFARETLSRLQELTKKVADEVDQHTERVEEVNAQLANTEENDESTVLAAVAQLIEANDRMQRELDSAEERLQAQARQIESHAVEARTDALTQVANRRALDDELARCVADFARRGTPTTVMLLDVDHFKQVNDRYGHLAGDLILQSVAKECQKHLRSSDMFARYGGEEFICLLPEQDQEGALETAERIRQIIEQNQVPFESRSIGVTASVGLAPLQAVTNLTLERLIDQADQALYQSKKNGRNRVTLWQDNT